MRLLIGHAHWLAVLVIGCGGSESQTVPPVDGGNSEGSGAAGGAGGAGGGAGAPGGSGGSSGSAGTGATGGSGGTGGSTGGVGGEAATGGGGGTPSEDFCTIAKCPVGVDTGLTETPNTFRAENSGPYWDATLPAPAGAKCWCATNERDDFPCTTDADCDLSTCDTANGICFKPGQHTHGPFDASLNPQDADGTQGSHWGDHQGPNCPYWHLHGTFTGPADTGGTTDPPDDDQFPTTCGHGGLIWLGDNGIINGP